MRLHRSSSGFSLIETVIALGIIATVLLAVLGLVPIATEASADASAKTAVGALLEDLQGRVEGTELKATPVDSPIVFYYDEGGDFVDSASTADEQLQRRYRAEVILVEPANQWYQSNDPDPSLFAMKVQVFWPIDPVSGDALGAPDPSTGKIPSKSRVTYFVNTLTGRDWPKIDSSYIPKVEF